MAHTFTEDQVYEAYVGAPQAIQDALTEGPAIDFMIALRSRYNLHVDTAGVITELIRNTLLGLINPAELLSELESAGLAAASANSLIQDLNKEVFVPLHEAMRTAAETAPPKPAPSEQPVPVRPAIQEPSRVETPVASQPPLIPQQPPAQPPTISPPPVVPPPPEAPASVAAPTPATSTPAVSPAALPVVRTMATDIEALQHPQEILPTHAVYASPNPGAQHAWQPAAAVHIFVPAPHPPTPPASVPRAMAPVPPPSDVVPVHRAPQIPPTPHTTTPPTKESASDPYREPIG